MEGYRARRADPARPAHLLDPAFATRSRSYVGLAGFGIEIDATEPLDEGASHRLTLKKPREPLAAADC